MSEHWDNPFDTCDCSRSDTCRCGGRVWDFIPTYRRVLQYYRPRWVYEWGPGISTAMALGAGASVWAVEHDERYATQIAPIPDVYTCDHIELDDDAYVVPQDLEADIYFVDGRRRAECVVNVALMAIGRRSILCLHDAQRERYQYALGHWKYVKFLTRGFAVASFEPIEE